MKVKVQDTTGAVRDEEERSFGTREWIPGYLDFWPFSKVTKIPHGETREINVELPSGHGSIFVELRYRDWFTVKDKDIVFATLTHAY